jgi:hypothetical protein
MVVALGVIACSGADVTPTASPIPTPVYHLPSPTTAAPTFSPTPVPTPDPSLLAIRPCLASDLVLRSGPPHVGAGNIWYIVGVSNVSTTHCRIPIAPTVDMIAANDDVLGTIGRGGDCGSLFPIYQTCPNTVVILSPGPPPTSDAALASFLISWGNPSISGESCNNDSVGLALELPDGGRINLEGISMPRCARPGTDKFATAKPPTPSPQPTVGYR